MEKKKVCRYLPAFVLSLLILLMLFPSITAAVSIGKNIEDKLSRDGRAKVIIVLKESKESEGSINLYAEGKEVKSGFKQTNIRMPESAKEKQDRMNKIKDNILEEINGVNENTDYTKEDNASIKNPYSGLQASTEIKPSVQKINSIISPETKKITEKLTSIKKFSTLNGFAGTVTKDGLERLKSNPDVAAVYEDGVVKLSLSDSKSIVNALSAWRLKYSGMNITGKGETICILDSGVDYTHPNLGGCSQSQFLGGNCSKIIGGYDFANDDDNPMDDHGHGTSVSGVIASNDSVYTGMAPDAKIVMIKVLDSGGTGYSSDLIEGINWCVNNANQFKANPESKKQTYIQA